MPDEWRQIAPRRLTEAQRQVKAQLDTDYEQAVIRVYAEAKAQGDLASAKTAKDQLYYLYLLRARQEGLYELIPVAQQIAELQDHVRRLSERITEIKAETPV